MLGACEAGFFPGVILYLTYWFPDRTRAKVMGLFYFGAPLAFMFGSPLSGYLLRFDGVLGLHGYQWMFMLEGLAVTAVGVWAYFYLDDRPADARWLDDEKHALVAMLQAEQSAKVSHGPHGADSALSDRTVLYFGLVFFLIHMGVSVAVFYLLLFVGKLLGTGPNALVGFVVAIPWACSLRRSPCRGWQHTRQPARALRLRKSSDRCDCHVSLGGLIVANVDDRVVSSGGGAVGSPAYLLVDAHQME